MKLTPLDIRHREFARAMRGYKDLEVDEFLDDIADEFERLFNENIDHKERLETLEEKNEQYKNIEETLKKTLVSAQQQAEELKQNAKKEADLILRDAELKARSILNDSYAERQKIQRSVQSLKQKQEDLKYQMRSLLETYMNLIDQDGELAGGELYDGSDAIAARQSQSAAAAAVPEAAELPPSAEPVFAVDPSGADAGIGEAVAPARPAMSGDELAPMTGAPSAGHDAPIQDEGDNPFADVEIDTDDSKFKW